MRVLSKSSEVCLQVATIQQQHWKSRSNSYHLPPPLQSNIKPRFVLLFHSVSAVKLALINQSVMATTEPAENGSTLAPELDLQPASVANDSDQQTFRNPTTDSVESAQKPNSLESESALPAQPSTATTTATTVLPPEKRWPGWPGDCVFRLIVPVSKVGSIIGRKGDIIKRMCEETRARIKILEGPIGSPDRIVTLSNA